MIKNIVIATQSILLLAGALWFVSYKHVIEQTHLVSGLGFMANETRFMTRVEKRIADGQCTRAQQILRETAASNVADMKSLVQQLDMRVPGQLGTARDYAKILHDVGIYDISWWIERRAKQEDSADKDRT